jgi:protein involved in polysaccharide export with SLBB domain
MRILVSLLIMFSCAIAWSAEAPKSNNDHPKPGDVYKLDTADVVAISSVDSITGSCDCVLHVVQIDGTLHLPFAKVKARGKTIAEIRESIKSLTEEAKQHGMADVAATIVDLRNPANDGNLQRLN